MVIRNIKDLDCNNIRINHPYKHDDNYYIGEIYYNLDQFVIQTPIMTFKNIEDNTVELILDKSTLKCINKIDNYVINTLSEMSTEWFNNELSVEDTKDIYKSSISFPEDEYDIASLKLKCNNKFKIYDKHNPSIDPVVVKYGTPIIALIKLTNIIFYKHTCLAQWECMSIKLKPNSKITECAIVDDENDENIKVVNLNEM